MEKMYNYNSYPGNVIGGYELYNKLDILRIFAHYF